MNEAIILQISQNILTIFSMASSSESLSSDARSKISIKKRSNSPPRTVAPCILPKQPSQRTLTVCFLFSFYSILLFNWALCWFASKCAIALGNCIEPFGVRENLFRSLNVVVSVTLECSNDSLQLQQQSSSSIDSLNSTQTTRTTSSVRLPTRILVNQSSTSPDSPDWL